MTGHDLSECLKARANGVLLDETHSQWPMKLILCSDVLPERAFARTYLQNFNILESFKD